MWCEHRFIFFKYDGALPFFNLVDISIYLYNPLVKTFYQLLINTLIVGTKNMFVWFALIFWAYLQTQSVIATGILGGIVAAAQAISSFWFGALVDNHKKKNVMLFSNIVTLFFYILGFVIYLYTPQQNFTTVTSSSLWIFSSILLLGVIFGNIYNIAIPTLITALVKEEDHDKANGMFGTITGITFALTSVASGLVLGNLGMYWVLVLTLIFTVIPIIHLLFIKIEEKSIIHVEGIEETTKNSKKVDIKGTIQIIKTIPGLFALIFYSTFNNFLGGVFMALMDAYGLTLVSVQTWGIIWGILSFGFIFGGFYISKKGLGENPVKTMLMANVIVWTSSIFFTVQPWLILLCLGILTWLFFFPFIEAAEQTVIQKVVPQNRQGRVFGFAQSIEQAASPITAFIVGPLTQVIFIPFMTNGLGAQLIGSWYGTGEGRGMALVFSLAGIVGLIVSLMALRSNSYKKLVSSYKS